MFTSVLAQSSFLSLHSGTQWLSQMTNILQCQICRIQVIDRGDWVPLLGAVQFGLFLCPHLHGQQRCTDAANMR